jgi:hypothetical protein
MHFDLDTEAIGKQPFEEASVRNLPAASPQFRRYLG